MNRRRKSRKKDSGGKVTVQRPDYFPNSGGTAEDSSGLAKVMSSGLPKAGLVDIRAERKEMKEEGQKYDFFV